MSFPSFGLCETQAKRTVFDGHFAHLMIEILDLWILHDQIIEYWTCNGNSPISHWSHVLVPLSCDFIPTRFSCKSNPDLCYTLSILWSWHLWWLQVLSRKSRIIDYETVHKNECEVRLHDNWSSAVAVIIAGALIWVFEAKNVNSSSNETWLNQ